MNLPGSIPRAADGEEVTFAEPWQARAFAMVVSLHERGLFAWAEWADTLAARIKAAQTAGDPDIGDAYYHHWLGALEDLLARKDIGSPAETARWRTAWQHAANRTPHGEPIELRDDELDAGHDTGGLSQ
jgi:nitrile hydratase accessory protein